MPKTTHTTAPFPPTLQLHSNAGAECCDGPPMAGSVGYPALRVGDVQLSSYIDVTKLSNYLATYMELITCFLANYSSSLSIPSANAEQSSEGHGRAR